MRKLACIFCVLGLLVPATVMSQTAQEQKAPPSKKTAPMKEVHKLPVPSAKVKKLAEAYGSEKQYCCQIATGCISGTKDGSKVCKEVGGTASNNSYCAEKKCVDP